MTVRLYNFFRPSIRIVPGSGWSPASACRTPVSPRLAEKSRNRQWGLKLHDELDQPGGRQWLNLRKNYELRLAEQKAGHAIRHLPTLDKHPQAGI
jgi:hypothetical protein